MITNAAVGHGNVKALVYIAGFAPDEGESLFELVTMNPGSELGPTTLITRPYPLPYGEGTDLYITRKGFRTAFAADLPRSTTDLMFATQRPFSEEAFESPSGTPAWTSIPSWYLVASQDRAIPPVTQRFMAERAGAQTTTVASSHVPQSPSPAPRPKSSWKLLTRSTNDQIGTSFPAGGSPPPAGAGAAPGPTHQSWPAVPGL